MTSPRARTAFGALALALATQLMFAATAAAERVPARAGVHPGYGRLVFDWPAPVGHSTSLSGRTLTIAFDRSIEAAFGTVERVLAGYVDKIAVAADGKTVVATLKADFRMRSFRAGNRVVVDLLANGDNAPAAAAPAIASVPAAQPRPLGPAGRAAAAAPAQVMVRASRTDDYGRLVFAWPRKVPFTVDRQGQSVAIRFDAPATIDIDGLRRNLPPQINSAVIRPDASRLDIGLVVAEGAQLRYFHNGADVVFDVVSPAPAARPARPPRRLGPSARDGQDAGAASRTTAARGGGKVAERAAAVPPLDTGPLVSVDSVRRGAELSIRFNWRHPVDAAVFRRDSALWIVFGQPGRIDLNSVRQAGTGLFSDVAQRPMAGGAAVRLALTTPHDVKVGRDGMLWTVDLAPPRGVPVDGLKIQVRRGKDGGAIVAAPAEGPGPVHVVVDPDVGDAFYVVPQANVGLGTRVHRRFAEFELLDSTQGVAVRPLDERVRVARDATRVIVSRPGGLTISEDVATIAAKREEQRESRLLDLNAWLYGPTEDFRKIESSLFQHVTEGDGIKRGAARLGLARFYVAHGMGAEAIGVLAALERDDPAMLRDAGFRALRGAARYLIGQYAEAAAEFDHPLLKGEMQIAPWRAGIAAARGDWRGAYRLFADTDAVVAGLPPRFAIPFGLLAAEAALSVDDLEAADSRLGILERAPASGVQLDRIAYLRGHFLKKQEKPDKAIALWENVAAQDDRPTRAKAAFALVNTLYDSKKITAGEAIERLEQLRFAWRDDVFEFDLLQRLGALYAENKDMRNALITLRQAATHFKDIKGAQPLTQEMRRLFQQFYESGDADAVAPVVALGLFDEFRELTPPGAEGDRLIRRLADRLIAVDLLPDAAELLDHLVRFRLKDGEKVETGTRLAEIRLADRKYDAALAALEASKVDKIDEALAQRRHYIAINAHTEAGRTEEAMRLIGNDSNDEADTLRARLQWRIGAWADAAQTLARLTGGFSMAALQDHEAELLLRRAVALALAGNKQGLAYVRERFGDAMEKTARAAAFKAVVGRDPLKTEDFAALARQAAELDTFTPFINKLRERRPAAQDQTAQADN